MGVLVVGARPAAGAPNLRSARLQLEPALLQRSNGRDDGEIPVAVYPSASRRNTVTRCCVRFSRSPTALKHLCWRVPARPYGSSPLSSMYTRRSAIPR